MAGRPADGSNPTLHRLLLESLLFEGGFLLAYGIVYGVAWPQVEQYLHLTHATKIFLRFIHESVLVAYSVHVATHILRLLYYDWSGSL